MSDATTFGQVVVGVPIMAALIGLWVNIRKDRRETEAAQESARVSAEAKAEARTAAVTASIAANQKTTDDRITALDHATDVRFRGIEQTLGEHAGQFMPRDHIMQEFRHAKQNRETAEAQILRLHESLAVQVRDNAIGLARTTEQTALLNSTMGEVKTLIKEGFEKVGNRIDKLQEGKAA